MEAFSPQKVVKMFEKVIVSWWEVRWISQMRQNFVTQFVQLLKHWLCDVWSGIVTEKNWAHSVGQCWLLLLQFLVCLINLLSILLRCNGFARTQKTITIQLPGSDRQQATKYWPWPFFGASLALESALAPPHGPTTELVITYCQMKSTFHCTPQCNWEMDHCCKE